MKLITHCPHVLHSRAERQKLAEAFYRASDEDRFFFIIEMCQQCIQDSLKADSIQLGFRQGPMNPPGFTT